MNLTLIRLHRRGVRFCEMGALVCRDLGGRENHYLKLELIENACEDIRQLYLSRQYLTSLNLTSLDLTRNQSSYMNRL